MSADAQMAKQRFELENEIIDEEQLFTVDQEEIDKMFRDRPWKKK